ncbi:MAG: DUF177 domain-containing protein [Ignavibacteriaceae bacterium]
MIIKIAGLSDGVHNFSFDEAIEEIGLKKPFFGNFHLDAELTKSHNQLVLSAEITLNAEFECDRCTANYESVVKSKYRMVYFFGKEPAGDDEVNIKYLPHEADKIKLDEELRDYSVLAIPMKMLCKEDCKGLCRNCGSDLNEVSCGCADQEIDARWMPLQELKSKLNNN